MHLLAVAQQLINQYESEGIQPPIVLLELKNSELEHFFS